MLISKVALSKHAGTSGAAPVILPEVDPYTQKWSKFFETLGAALDMSESIHLAKAVVVTQQAPQEFSTVLEHRSANIIGNLFIFLVVETPRSTAVSDKELQIFQRIVKSLLDFGAQVLPTSHPVHQLLRSFVRWETEGMENFTQKNSASCQPIPR